MYPGLPEAILAIFGEYERRIQDLERQVADMARKETKSYDTDISNLQATDASLSNGLNTKAAASHDHASTYAPNPHTHDYAATSHNHDTAYSGTSHTHNYAATSHTHPYAADNHNHDTAYSGTSHTHPYAATSHDHNAAYSGIGHDHGTLYANINHPHTGYAASDHNHNTAYSVLGHTHASYALAADLTAEHDRVTAISSQVADLLNWRTNTYSAHKHVYTKPASGSADYTSTPA